MQNERETNAALFIYSECKTNNCDENSILGRNNSFTNSSHSWLVITNMLDRFVCICIEVAIRKRNYIAKLHEISTEYGKDATNHYKK